MWDFLQLSSEWGFVITLLIAYVGGIISSFTPCVYPMIPITIAVIGAAKAESRWQALQLGLIFASGIALTYAILGVVSALTGSLLGVALQHPVVVAAISLMFIIFGLSMLGLFDIRLPAGLARILAGSGSQSKLGIFVTGAITGVVVAPCVGPVVLGLLTYISTQQDVVRGFLLMLSFAFGLSTLFVVLGLFSSMLTHLPKQGEWMLIVKRLLGLLLLGAGFYFAHLLFDPLVFAILIVVALGLLAFAIRRYELFGHRTSYPLFIASLLGALLVFALLVTPKLDRRAAHALPSPDWRSDYREALAEAKRDRKPVLIDFYAEWCIACKELDRHVYSKPSIIQLSESFVPLKLDFSELNPELEGYLDFYNVVALPVILFLDAEGAVLKNRRIDGFMGAVEFEQHLHAILKQLPANDQEASAEPAADGVAPQPNAE